jgi:hypothetical protein
MKTTAVASDTLGFDGFFSALLPIPSPFSYPSLVLLRYLKEPSLVFRFDGKLRLLLSILRFYATIPPYQTTQVSDRHICINACVYAFYISLSKSFQKYLLPTFAQRERTIIDHLESKSQIKTTRCYSFVSVSDSGNVNRDQNLRNHDTSTSSNSHELSNNLLDLSDLVGSSLHQLRHNAHAYKHESSCSPGQQEVTPVKAGSEESGSGHGISAVAAVFLDCDTHECACESACCGKELCADGCALGEAGLDEESKVSNLVRNLYLDQSWFIQFCVYED